jgi:hypothetical protein
MWEGKYMQKHIGWLGIVGFSVGFAAANAQTSSPSAGNTQFDGTYAFVFGAVMNETSYTTGTNRVGRCGYYPKTGSLTIVNGHARYSGSGPVSSAGLEGTVGSHGELTMRRDAEPEGRHGGISPGVEMMTVGRIDGNGTIRARQIGYNCSYDFTWQKESR